MMNITENSEAFEQSLEKMQRENELLIQVDENNQVLGAIEKITAHRFPGTHHRAFTCFLQNENGDLLITQRSKFKPLWPLWWDGACSSHQWYPKEYAVEACLRRLPFELGIELNLIKNLKEVFVYEYRAEYSQEWVEHEHNSIVVGEYSGDWQLNPHEVADLQLYSVSKFEILLNRKTLPIAPWVPLAWPQLQSFLK